VSRTRYVAQAGVIAAVYGVLTWLTIVFGGVLAWGPVQLRLSEVATILPLFTPAAIPGLTIGSIVANGYNYASSGNPVFLLDVVLGSLGTLLGAVWTWRFRSRTWLALLGPVVSNAVIVAAYLPILLKGIGVHDIPLFGLSLDGAWLPLYAVFVVSIALSEAVVVYGLGAPLLVALRRTAIAGLLGR
jgi:uncharacterized membrane protein